MVMSRRASRTGCRVGLRLDGRHDGAGGRRLVRGAHRTAGAARVEVYLAHKKAHPPRTLP